MQISTCPTFVLSPGLYVMMLIGLIFRPVIIAMIILPFVDSLVFRTASHSYSESHANQFFEIHQGECDIKSHFTPFRFLF